MNDYQVTLTKDIITMTPEEVKAKKQEEIKAKMQEGFAKIQPKVAEMTSIIMDAYQEGFENCWEILTGQKMEDKK